VPITADGPPILTYIPQFPWYPVEADLSDPDHTDIKSAVARDNGKSKLVYFAEDIEATYWRTGGDDLGDLVTNKNALRWNDRQQHPTSGGSTGLVETYGWETEVGYAVHLINYTNPNFRHDRIAPHVSGRRSESSPDAPRSEADQESPRFCIPASRWIPARPAMSWNSRFPIWWITRRRVWSLILFHAKALTNGRNSSPGCNLWMICWRCAAWFTAMSGGRRGAEEQG